MPLLNLHTNISIDDSDSFIQQLSAHVAQQLGKPESYVMIRVADRQQMSFSGSLEACAYIELKSLGLPEDETPRLSNSLCEFLQERLGLETGRIYIEFSSPERHMWGWDKRTF